MNTAAFIAGELSRSSSQLLPYILGYIMGDVNCELFKFQLEGQTKVIATAAICGILLQPPPIIDEERNAILIRRLSVRSIAMLLATGNYNAVVKFQLRDMLTFPCGGWV